MTKEEALAEMKKLTDHHDREEAHMKADSILCTLLEQEGYTDIVRVWAEMPKWYA